MRVVVWRILTDGDFDPRHFELKLAPRLLLPRKHFNTVFDLDVFFFVFDLAARAVKTDGRAMPVMRLIMTAECNGVKRGALLLAVVAAAMNR